MTTNPHTSRAADMSTADNYTGPGFQRDPDPPMPWEVSEPDPLVSTHTRSIITMALQCYVQQLIVMLGIPGNVICCIVFLKQGLSDRINLLLFWLAVADLINLVTHFVLKFNCYIKTWSMVQAVNWVTVMNSRTVYIGVWASFVSGALIVIMSVDRCLSVVMPLRAGRLLTYRPMLTAILMTYVGLLVVHLPSLLIYTVKWRVDPLTNHSIAYMTFTDWFTLDKRLAVKTVAIFGTIVKPAFVVVVTLCSIITIVKLRQASRQRLQMQEKGKQGLTGSDNRITKMLLFLCIVYVVLVLPQVSSHVTYYFVPDFFVNGKYKNTFKVVYGVIFTGSCLNSTVNFFAYLVLSSKFRATLREVCPCCRRIPFSRVRKSQEVPTSQQTDLSITHTAF